MKNALPPAWLSFLLLILLLRCSSTPPTQNAKGPGIDGQALSAAESETFQYASSFDKFLAGELGEKDESALKKSCETSNKNPFCYSILNYEQIINPPTPPRPPKHRHQSAVYPKIKKGKIQNWYDLRFSNVNVILRGLNAASPKEIEKVREYALKENGCPNNAAIAMGADLEDQLPDRISYEDIAKLYEKGAQCPMESKADQENVLTRAGVFYFAANQLDKAKENLLKSTSLTDTYRARALYWLYRVQTAQKDEEGAGETWLQLKTQYPFTFHTLVVATTKNQDPGEILESKWDPRLKRTEHKSTANTFVEQYEILKTFKFERSAGKVLDWALAHSQGAEPEFRMHLAELKDETGDHLKKFSVMSDVLYKHPHFISRKTMEQYFPKVYFPIFEKNSLGVDPLLLISIARRESAFNARAVSSANARGLLQVTPGTLREMRMKKDLFDPESNVFAGARRFSDMLNRLNNQIHLSLAAYNAGPNRVDQWMARYPITDPILFIDLIPYRETREYVAAVLRNYYWYRRIHQYSSDAPPSVLVFESKVTR